MVLLRSDVDPVRPSAPGPVRTRTRTGTDRSYFRASCSQPELSSPRSTRWGRPSCTERARPLSGNAWTAEHQRSTGTSE